MNKLPLIVLFILTASTLTAQDSDTTNYFDWSKTPDRIEVPKNFASEDVVVIEDDLIIFPAGNYSEYISQIYYSVLTKAGLEMGTVVQLPVSSNQMIKTLSVRTIKANGEVVILDSSSIKLEYQLNRAGGNDNSGNLKFFIPNVEVGDEIQIIHGYYAVGFYQENEHFLYGNYPTIKKNILIRTPSYINILAMTYNGMPKPYKAIENSFNFVYWQENMVPGMEYEPYSIPHLELPYMRFRIYERDPYMYEFHQANRQKDISNWAEFANEFKFDNCEKKPEKVGKMNSLKIFYHKLNVENPGINKYDKLLLIHEFINKEINYVDLNEDEMSMPVGYFFKNKKIDRNGLLRLYDYVLNTLGFDYYLGLGRNRYTGPIDKEFIAGNQISDFFYALKIDSGKYHYLFPKDPYFKYEINEINPDLQNTNCILLKVGSKEVKETVLPFVEPLNNMFNSDYNATVDLSDETMELNSRRTISGCNSTYWNDMFLKAEKENKLREVILGGEGEEDVDTLYIESYSNKFPFTMKLRMNYTNKTAISKIDKNLYSINLNGWRLGDVEKVDTTERTLDYYPRFLESQKIRLYLSFDKDIEIMNLDKLTKKVRTDFGVYKSTVSLMGTKRVLVEAEFGISKIPIISDKVKLLAKLHSIMDDNASEPLIIQVKE